MVRRYAAAPAASQPPSKALPLHAVGPMTLHATPGHGAGLCWADDSIPQGPAWAHAMVPCSGATPVQLLPVCNQNLVARPSHAGHAFTASQRSTELLPDPFEAPRSTCPDRPSRMQMQCRASARAAPGLGKEEGLWQADSKSEANSAPELIIVVPSFAFFSQAAVYSLLLTLGPA